MSHQIFRVNFLHYQGARPLCSYVEAVERRPRPTTIKELQMFLGLINFFRRFLPGAASILKPLTDALRGSKSAQESIAWSQEMEVSFEAAKRALSSTTWLGHPDPGSALALHWTLRSAMWGRLYTSVLEAALSGVLLGFSPRS
jgi:hypothetical protein